jgi:hypothetical protein
MRYRETQSHPGLGIELSERHEVVVMDIDGSENQTKPLKEAPHSLPPLGLRQIEDGLQQMWDKDHPDNHGESKDDGLIGVEEGSQAEPIKVGKDP